MSDDIVPLIKKADVHFKTVQFQATCYLAYNTAEILQLWMCHSTGKTEWRPLPDVDSFCEDNGIDLP